MIRRQTHPRWVLSQDQERLMSDGEFVSAWLNDERERSTKENNGKNRIRKLLGLLQELQSEADSHPGVGTWQIPGAQATEKNLQKLTHYYRSWPRYFIVGP